MSTTDGIDWSGDSVSATPGRLGASARRGFWYVAGTGIFLTLVELGCRLALGNARLDAPVYEPTPASPGYRLAANRRSQVRQFGRVVRVTTTSEGLRATPSVGEEGQPIHVIGDSQVFGWGLSDDETVPARLQRRLGTGFRVMNHGVPGYGPLEYREISRRIPLTDWVVLVLTEQNDLWDSYGTRWLASAVCGYMTTRASLLGRVTPCWLRDSRALQWGADALRGRALEMQPTPLHFEPSSRVAARLLMGRAEALVRDERAARGTKFLVTFVPWSGAFRPERQGGVSPAPALERAAAFPDDCAIEQSFAASPVAPEQLYIDGDDHLSPAGAATLAEAISRRLAELLRATLTAASMEESKHDQP